MGNLNEKCGACTRVIEGNCKVYAAPDIKWRNNNKCPMATFTHEMVATSNKDAKKVNPLKANKRQAKKK